MEVDLYSAMYTLLSELILQWKDDEVSPTTIHKGEADLWKQNYKIWKDAQSKASSSHPNHYFWDNSFAP